MRAVLSRKGCFVQHEKWAFSLGVLRGGGRWPSQSPHPPPPPPPETAGAARRGSCRGAERGRRRFLGSTGGVWVYLDRPQGDPSCRQPPCHPTSPSPPAPPYLHSQTLTHTCIATSTHTHTNAQWTLIEELVYYVRSTSTTVGSRKMDDADKALVPSHINLITSLAVFFISRWIFFFLKEMQSCLNCLFVQVPKVSPCWKPSGATLMLTGTIFHFHLEPVPKVILHACTFLFSNKGGAQICSQMHLASSAVNKVEDLPSSLWRFFLFFVFNLEIYYSGIFLIIWEQKSELNLIGNIFLPVLVYNTIFSHIISLKTILF